MNTINNRFVHLSDAQAGRTLFGDGSTVSSTGRYYILTGGSVTEAALEEFSGNRDSYTLIPSTAIVFVDFPDGTTGIISHLKFYSKLEDLGGGSTPPYNGVKVLRDAYSTFPTETIVDLGVEPGDVCVVRNYSSGVNNFAVAVCEVADTQDDGSGGITYSYSWQEVYRWSFLDNDWSDATTPLGS